MNLTMPEILRATLIASFGAILLKIVEHIFKSGRESHQTSLELRKELRDEIVFLHTRIETLEADLEAIKTKYWEDVELIYQLKTTNITLRSRLVNIKNIVETGECDCSETCETRAALLATHNILISGDHDISATAESNKPNAE